MKIDEILRLLEEHAIEVLKYDVVDYYHSILLKDNLILTIVVDYDFYFIDCIHSTSRETLLWPLNVTDEYNVFNVIDDKEDSSKNVYSFDLYFKFIKRILK